MSISRSMPRKGWTLLTAILATIAVIAALLTVPLNKASAAEPTDFVPNTTLGNEDKKEEKAGTIQARKKVISPRIITGVC